MLPEPAHPRQVVLELRELDLELSLGAASMLREDVEDELRSIDDTGLEDILQRLLLRGAELLVDEQHLRVRGRVGVLQLGELSLSHERPLIRTSAVLNDLADRRHSGRACQLTQLGELGLPVDALGEDSDHEPALRVGPGCAVGLARGHCRIMPRMIDS